MFEDISITDRYFWHALDPHNISEGLFAIANIISFTRLSFLLPANELFGPMQISLARMITVSWCLCACLIFSL